MMAVFRTVVFFAFSFPCVVLLAKAYYDESAAYAGIGLALLPFSIGTFFWAINGDDRPRG